MKRSFAFKNVFAKISLFAFLMCVIFASCQNGTTNNNNTNDENKNKNNPPNLKGAPEMSMKEFEDILDNKDNKNINDYLVLDVRRIHEVKDKDGNVQEDKSYEYQKGHTFCAVSIPFDDKAFDAKIRSEDWTCYDDASIFNCELLKGMENRNIIVQCRTDNRSQKVGKILENKGYKNVKWVYGVSKYPETKDKQTADLFKFENKTKIPAILYSQIASKAKKVIDVRSKAEFDAGHYKEGNIEAEHCADINQYPALSRTDMVVVMAANARVAYEAAQVLEKNIGLKDNEFVEQVYICVESKPYTK